MIASVCNWTFAEDRSHKFGSVRRELAWIFITLHRIELCKLVSSDLERRASESPHGTGRADLTSRSQASFHHDGIWCLHWLEPNTPDVRHCIPRRSQVNTLQQHFRNLKTSSDCFCLTSCKSLFCHSRLDVCTASGLACFSQAVFADSSECQAADGIHFAQHCVRSVVPPLVAIL